MIRERKTTPRYDIDYFIQLYSGFKNEDCCTKKLVTQDPETNKLKYCVLGFLHYGNGAWDMFRRRLLLMIAPNCVTYWDSQTRKYPQEYPLERLLAYLKDILQQKEASKAYYDNKRILDN